MDPTKTNRVLGAVKTVPAWFRPVCVPGVTRPEDWRVVRLPNSLPGYIETKLLTS